MGVGRRALGLGVAIDGIWSNGRASRGYRVGILWLCVSVWSAGCIVDGAGPHGGLLGVMVRCVFGLSPPTRWLNALAIATKKCTAITRCILSGVQNVAEAPSPRLHATPSGTSALTSTPAAT